MKNKNKKKVIVGIILVSLILIFGQYFGLFTVGYQQATTYNSWSTDLNKLELTYTDTSTEALRANAFKSIHALSLDAGANDFNDAILNKRFWRFFLESNNVESDNFRDYSGRTIAGVFSSITIPGLFHDELELLGFSYNYKIYTKQVFVGDQKYCCGSSNCCADPSWMVFPKCCYTHEQTVVTGEEIFWAGGYKNSVMTDMANRMACYVKGKTTALADDIYIKSDRSQTFIQNYKIYGDVYFDGDSFTCHVDTKELFNELPKTFIRPDGAVVNVGGVGVKGDVVFYFGERIYKKYRLENNLCNSVEVEESKIAPNDFIYLSDCQEKIINYIDVYRIENNICNKYTINEKSKLSSDYINLYECELNFIDIYRLENNKCNFYTINKIDKTNLEYFTLSECKSKIINYIDIYRIENNLCNAYTINELNKTNLEYSFLSECKTNLIKLQTYYRFQDNECLDVLIYPYDSTEVDYSTLSECESNIKHWYTNKLIIIAIVLLILMVSLLFFKKK